MKPTQEQVIAWAREAGFKVNWQHSDVAEIKAQRYEQFAALVAAAEREACAKVCMEDASLMRGGTPPQIALMEAAAAIRARGE